MILSGAFVLLLSLASCSQGPSLEFRFTVVKEGLLIEMSRPFPHTIKEINVDEVGFGKTNFDSNPHYFSKHSIVFKQYQDEQKKLRKTLLVTFGDEGPQGSYDFVEKGEPFFVGKDYSIEVRTGWGTSYMYFMIQAKDNSTGQVDASRPENYEVWYNRSPISRLIERGEWTGNPVSPKGSSDI